MAREKLFVVLSLLLVTTLFCVAGQGYAETKASLNEPLEDILAGAAGRFKPSDVKAAAVRQAAAIAKARQRSAARKARQAASLSVPPLGPGDTPDYYSTPNWAFSPPLRKFIDNLPLLWDPRVGGPTPAKCIPLAVPDIVTFPGSDYYEIELREYSEMMHTDLVNPTTLRGYVQVNNGTDTSVCGGVSQPPCQVSDNTVVPALIRYLGPLIITQRDRPVRIKFSNKLAFGPPDPVTGRRPGDLFIPVDGTVMGSGDFEIDYDPVTLEPIPLTMGTFTQNRATLHLHGGRTPWISDGTPHQWITPEGETTDYPRGVSVQNVPDMFFDPVTHNPVPSDAPGATNDPGPGAQTFYWTNQQSARLMFFHDHAWGITRLNVYAGEAAGYLITDAAEQALVYDPATNPTGPVPADQIPLIIQDKTFVDPATITATDPTWAWGSQPWNGTPGAAMTPVKGDLWWPHVYMPAQNPFNPDMSGINPMGRWMYGPWFWPPTPVCGTSPQAVTPWCISHGVAPNPYYDPLCDPVTDGFCQPPEIPGTPSPSWGAEAFLDTMMVNGTAYPTLTVDPKEYRLRILNAAHDRFLNLQLYQAVSKVGYANPTLPPYDFAGGGLTDLTEVAMVPAAPNAAFPANWPADGREGGAPDPATRGPAFIQIGTEGGFLPAPVLLPNQPVRWNLDPTMFNVGNVLPQPDGGGTLILGPAERADVIVDFSNFAGKTLILYNDAPTAFPALAPPYDYYTGAPDRTMMGGAPPVLPGMGPNIRTVMQIHVTGDGGSGPADDFNAATLANLQAAFASTGSVAGGTFVPGVFAASQEPIIVGQKSYESAYSAIFPGTWPSWGVSRISDTSLGFKTVNPDNTVSAPLTLAMKPKAIHDEMGGSFDEYGRMAAKLGLEVPLANAAISTFAMQSFVDPPTEILNGSEVQIWKITHNGVDTHPIHFHLFDVQVINRVGWDGFIRLPDPNELGWKDTVRMAPLEDTIVALRPVVPTFPFPVPDSIRPLNPMVPIGSMMGFSQVNPLTGGRLATPVENMMADFGWEYVWHCHILSHEENDMMRPIVFLMPPPAPSNLVAVQGGTGVNLTWTDNSASETGFTLQRAEDPDFTIGLTAFPIPPSAPATAYGGTIAYLDATAMGIQYYYRVQAFSSNGVSAWSNIASVFPAPIIGVSPASLAFGNQPVFTTSAAQVVTVSNTGSAVLNIAGIGLTGLNPADFAQTSACGPSLAPASTCTISVTFTPSAIGGRVAGLTITSDDPVHPTLTVGLSGTGTTPIAGVSPPALLFGNQLLATTSLPQTVTLSNTGNAPLGGIVIGLAGADPGDFAQTSTCGATLAAGATCAISVTFTPSVMAPRTALLTVASNDPVNPSLGVALSGTGIAPIAGVAPTFLVFGDQLLNTASAGQAVILSNLGLAPLLLGGISISGVDLADFAQGNTCPASLAPGANCPIVVTFTPSVMGARGASLDIASSDPVNGLLSVPLSGIGIAPIAGVSPLALAFGSQLQNTASLPQTVTLSNTGTAPLVISGIAISGANPGDFAQVSACGPSLAALASCSIDVTFTPLAMGARSASLVIASSDPANPSLSVGLSGTGIAPIAGVSPLALAFGSQLQNTPSLLQTVTLSNTGTADLVIGGIVISGANAGDFAQVNACGGVLAAGATCGIDVTFTPLAMGPRAASLIISGSDPANPTLTVALGGTGIAPVAIVAPSALTFAAQLVNTTSPAQAVVLSNSGTATLLITGIGLAGANPGDFAQVNTCGTSLAAGTNCPIIITFTPLAMGPRGAALVISGSDPVNPTLTVTLNGTGIAPVAGISPLSLVFENQLLNTTSPAQTVTLSNTGTAPLLISGIGFTGANAAYFAQVNACGASLAAGATCPIDVTFTPPVTGAMLATLTVATSDPLSPILTTSLSGAGVTRPARPGSLTATASPVSVNNPTVSLTWTDRSTTENGFTIQRARDQAFTQALNSFTVPANTTTYTDTTVKPNILYYYRVHANVSGGSSGWSNIAQVTTPGMLPATPTGLAMVGSTRTSITLGWTDNSGNELGFELQRSLTGTQGTWNTVTTLPANSTTYTNTGLTRNTIYWYRIRAYNALGNSPYGNLLSARTLARIALQ